MFFSVLLIVLNVPSTTETVPLLHPLSRHYALPISVRCRLSVSQPREDLCTRAYPGRDRPHRRSALIAAADRAAGNACARRRVRRGLLGIFPRPRRGRRARACRVGVAARLVDSAGGAHAVAGAVRRGVLCLAATIRGRGLARSGSTGPDPPEP